jgi:hypothetical protein
MVTSRLPAEGKRHCCSLAHGIASGGRGLLIDCDLRPFVRKLFGATTARGRVTASGCSPGTKTSKMIRSMIRDALKLVTRRTGQLQDLLGSAQMSKFESDAGTL